MALAVALSTGCGSDALPDLDVNGYWSLNPIESRYLTSDHFTASYIDDPQGVAMSTSFFEIRGLPSSREGGSADTSSFMRYFGSTCDAGWTRGEQAVGEVFFSEIPGDDLGWTDSESNLLSMREQWLYYGLYPMTCSFPHPDQMRCIWGWPGEPVGSPELRDTVLVFDRGDSAVRPAPCERLVEAAMHFPYDVWIDP